MTKLFDVTKKIKYNVNNFLEYLRIFLPYYNEVKGRCTCLFNVYDLSVGVPL